MSFLKCALTVCFYLFVWVCVCVLGWEGWGCTDNSEAYSYSFQLLSTLLLCLSNLMFVPPVAIAIRSHYLLEASVYIFTMFFSTVSDRSASKGAIICLFGHIPSKAQPHYCF